MINKDECKQKRKEAYQKAKAKREADPKYIEAKAKYKQLKKAKYKAIKEKIKNSKIDQKAYNQEQRDKELMALVKRASDLEKSAPNHH
jgi:hypothetical protein